MAYDQINSSWWLFIRSSVISFREPFNYGLRFLGLAMIMCFRFVLRERSLSIIDTECFNSTKFAKKIIEMGSNSDNYKITAFLSRDIILLITSIMFTVIISLIPSLMLFPLELSVFIKVTFFCDFPFNSHGFIHFRCSRNIQIVGIPAGRIMSQNRWPTFRQL